MQPRHTGTRLAELNERPIVEWSECTASSETVGIVYRTMPTMRLATLLDIAPLASKASIVTTGFARGYGSVVSGSVS